MQLIHNTLPWMDIKAERSDLCRKMKLTDKLFFHALLLLLDLPVLAYNLFSDFLRHKFSLQSAILLVSCQPAVTRKRVCDRALRYYELRAFTCIIYISIIYMRITLHYTKVTSLKYQKLCISNTSQKGQF